jgi:hypothetical protein
MKQIEQQFTAHPVGQGFFYSGLIRYKLDEYTSRNFLFVFDCGSEQKRFCREEVKKFREYSWPENRPLDLLIISHFHSDHINCLSVLLDKRSVKTVITPFVSFAERLTLAMIYRNSQDYNERDVDSDFTLRFILDPTEALEPFLAEGGGIIFLQEGGNEPFPPPPVTDSPPERANFQADFEITFGEDSWEMSRSERADLRCFGISRTMIMRDSSPFYVKLGLPNIMEFLFYRKPVGKHGELFFRTLNELFMERFKKAGPAGQTANDFIKRILSESAITRVITLLIKKAVRQNPQAELTFSAVKDLNTTSLSMLHFNLSSFYFFFPRSKAFGNTYFHSSLIKQLNTSDHAVYQAPLVFDCGYYLYNQQYYLNFPNDPHRKFPNVLLTADGYLLQTDDADRFWEKFRYYWNKFWLFQIPHHGSARNIDRYLLSKMPFDTFLLVNFGARNRYNHPSNQLINDIILTRHADKLVENNEFTGLIFGMHMDSYEE